VLSALALSTFVLLAATFRRWKWQEVVATAVVFGLVLLVANIIRGVIASGSDLATPIILATYLIVVAALLAYVSAASERSRTRFERLAQPLARKDLSDTASSIRPILAHAAMVMEAPRILVVWEDAKEPHVYWSYLREGHYQENREAIGKFASLVDPSLGDSAFLMDNANSEFLRFSNGRRRIKPPAINTDLIAKFSICSVATAAFAGTTCTGRVFIMDCNSPSDDYLTLTNFISCRIGMRLDRLALQRHAEAAIAAREKVRLTQDLHDGVLQSLTAAALQLGLVNNSSDPRLAVVAQLLAKEQRRIRNFVEETRVNPVSPDILCNSDLRQAVQDSGRYWNCTTSFSLVPNDATMPQSIADQVSFMLTEAVANAARHGGASKIDVAMEKANGHLDINIRDNGIGFGCRVGHKHEKQPASIRERVRVLGGSLNVTSFPDGAKLAIRVPLP